MDKDVDVAPSDPALLEIGEEAKDKAEYEVMVGEKFRKAVATEIEHECPFTNKHVKIWALDCKKKEI